MKNQAELENELHELKAELKLRFNTSRISSPSDGAEALKRDIARVKIVIASETRRSYLKLRGKGNERAHNRKQELASWSATNGQDHRRRRPEHIRHPLQEIHQTHSQNESP